MAVDKSPEEARIRGEAESATKVEKTKKRRELEAKHLADLKSDFGDVGKDNGKYLVGTDQYGNLILFEQLYNDKGEYLGQKEVFFTVAPDGITYKPLYGSGIIKEIKTAFKGNLDVLRKQLYDKNFMSKADFTTKNETAFNEAIIDAARNHGLTQVQKYTVEGETKFTPFTKWLSGLGSAGADGAENLPIRDINLMDRDVVEALVKDVYRRTTDMAIDDEFLKQETDRYMAQIKEGTLTTVTKKGGEAVRKTTKPFSQAQVEAELPKRIEQERPGATDPKKSFDFLAFLDGLGAPVV